MNFLVATDGSDEADDALAYATDITDAMGGSITVVHAVDPAVYDTGQSEPISGIADADRSLLIENVEDAEDRGLEILEDAATLAGELGQEVETELVYGDPVEAVTDYAEEQGFDTLFVGHRGRSNRADLMLGSVATAIVERATLPVTVVR